MWCLKKRQWPLNVKVSSALVEKGQSVAISPTVLWDYWMAMFSCRCLCAVINNDISTFQNCRSYRSWPCLLEIICIYVKMYSAFFTPLEARDVVLLAYFWHLECPFLMPENPPSSEECTLGDQLSLPAGLLSVLEKWRSKWSRCVKQKKTKKTRNIVHSFPFTFVQLGSTTCLPIARWQWTVVICQSHARWSPLPAY